MDLTTAKVSIVDVEAPPLAVDQTTPPGEFPGKTVPVNDVLQANHASLKPAATRDLVVLPVKFGDRIPFGLGTRKGGALVATNPTAANIRLVEFQGEKAIALNDGAVVAQADAEGTRYRTMVDLSSGKLRNMILGRQKGKTAFVDAAAEVEFLFTAALSGDSVSASSATWEMVHNQSTPQDITIDLPGHTNGTTVVYDVVAVVNIPASDYAFRSAQVTTTISVTRAAGGSFTAATITGGTSSTGEAFPPVVGNPRTHSDYKHTLSLATTLNGSSGFILNCTIDTEDYTYARKITVPWSAGVTVDSAGKLSATQNLDIWYNGGDTGDSVAMLGNTKPWTHEGTFEAGFYTNSPGFGDGDLEFKIFALADQMDLIVRPADLTDDFTTEFDKFSLKLQQTAASEYQVANHSGGTYAGSFVTAVVSEPAPAGYESESIIRTSQNFIMRFVMELG